MSDDSRGRFAALITAAGASRRMGSPKALVPWSGQPLLRHQLEVLRQVPEVGAIVVVLGADAEPIRAALATWPEVIAPDPTDASRTLLLVDNPRWSEGRSTSLEAGAQALIEPAPAVLVTAVDQPLEVAVVQALLAAFGPADEVLVPSHEGRRGHPIVLAASRVSLLRRASDYPQGLRDIVHASHVRALPVASAAILHDLNTPDDLRRAGE